MEIKTTNENGALTVKVVGSLDTTTSPDLQAALDAALTGVTALTLDFADLEYISSAGFRVLLMANKRLAAAGGAMKILGANPSVREVFEMTGFSDIFELA